MHFYAWSQGLKTGQYYLRSKPSRDPIKFTVDVQSLICESTDGMTHMNTGNKTEAEMKKGTKVRKIKDHYNQIG